MNSAPLARATKGHRMRRLLLASLCLQSAFSLGQQLSSADFKLSYSPQGLRSLKRVHDTYDTDYIAGGMTLGDVYLRYRTSGQSAWKEALSATAAAQSGQGLSYKI